MGKVQLKKPDENGWYTFAKKEIVAADTIKQIIDDLKLPERVNGIFQDFIKRYQLLTWINDNELISGTFGWAFTKTEPLGDSPYGDILFCVGDCLFIITVGHKQIKIAEPDATKS